MPGDQTAFEYWVGMDAHHNNTSDLAQFNSFYTSTHIPEVMNQYPGILSCERFELVEQDHRGPLGPEWLARYSMTDDGARHYFEVNSDPDYTMPFTDFPRSVPISIRWRLLWQSLSSEGSSSTSSAKIRLIGMNPAAGSTESELDSFNYFYDRVHIAEARRILGSNFVVRLQLAHKFSRNVSAAPNYAALYEIDSSRAPDSAQGQTAGPRSWEGRDTLWRLTYSLVDRVSRSA